VSVVLPHDTSPDAQAVQDDVYRRVGGRERVAIAFRLGATMRAITGAGILARHPDYSEDEVKRALARVVLGDALTRKVWPDRRLVDP
jgi:hypothetical protein